MDQYTNENSNLQTGGAVVHTGVDVVHDGDGHDNGHHHHKESFITKYIFSQDHKVIGKQFLVIAHKKC